MVEQEPVSKQISPGNHSLRSPYPRTGRLKWARDALVYLNINWWLVIPIVLALYIIFTLGVFVINHHNNISLLLNISNLISAFTQQIALGSFVLAMLIIIVLAQRWAEQDERRESAWQQQQQEQLPPPPGIVLHHTLEDHTATISCLAWSPDGHILASGSSDNTLRLWNPSTGELLRSLSGHTASVYCLAWAPDGRTLASGSYETTLRLWNPSTGQEVRILEGHTRYIQSLSFSRDGRLLASKSDDGTIRLWRTDTWTQVSTFYESSSNFWSLGLVFHPSQPILATLGKQDTIIRIWDLDIDTILGSSDTAGQSSYTNAKVVLLGDSGVGKSGLGLVLSGQQYIQTDFYTRKKSVDV